jgi:hypothetical protein
MYPRTIGLLCLEVRGTRQLTRTGTRSNSPVFARFLRMEFHHHVDRLKSGLRFILHFILLHRGILRIRTMKYLNQFSILTKYLMYYI